MPDRTTLDSSMPVDRGPLPDGASFDAGPPDAAAATVKWTYGTRAVGHPAIGPGGRICAIRGEWVSAASSDSAAGADEVVALNPDGCPSHSHLAGIYCECDEGYVVNAAGTACEPDTEGGASCAGRCGNVGVDGTCYCDAEYTANADCCADYQAQCG